MHTPFLCIFSKQNRYLYYKDIAMLRHFYTCMLFTVILAVVLFTSCTSRTITGKSADTYVIMLSIDGFRWDYAERVETPGLDYIALNGVRAKHLEPVFPTKTFPNHYSIATGLYPDNHGIVDNNFYCPELDATYRLGDMSSIINADFYGGEPIWVTAEKQDITTASYFWVGSEAPIKGIRPTYWKSYDVTVPFEDRIDKVISWLELPSDKRPQLITLYFNEPDRSGHNYGPEHPAIDSIVKYLDSLVGDLINRLNKFPSQYNINLIVTSDHGMTEITPERYVDMTGYVDRNWFERTHGGNPLLNLQPKEEYTDTIYNILKTVENISVWKRDEIPARFNYGNNPRVMDMIVLADSTWSVGWGKPTGSYYTGGSHGWDHEMKDMQTIFYAIGPAFKENYIHPPFSVIDLYPLIAHILNLEMAEVDGKLEKTKDMLK